MEVTGRSLPRHVREARRRLSVTSGALLVAFSFSVSRFWYYQHGVRFDVSTIGWFAQLLAPHLLRTRLLESLLYLHAQPPLFNLLTGLALKIAGARPQVVLQPVFLACSLYSGLCLYLIMLRLRMPILVSALCASVMLATPAFVLYENWYFYPQINVAWLLGALAWLAQSRGRPGWEMTLCAAHLAGLTLTRSLFHPLFFAVACGLVALLVAPGTRRRLLQCFAVPALLVVLWCGKNLVQFGFFGTSSWASRNVWLAVATLVGDQRVAAETRLHHLSPAVTMSPFASGPENIAAFGLTPHSTGIAALDQVFKVGSSMPSYNFNHWSYPASAHFYQHDVAQLIHTYPMAYLRGLREQSLPTFLNPVVQNPFLSPNRDRIASVSQSFAAFERSAGLAALVALGLAAALLVLLNRMTARAERIVLAVAFLTLSWGLCLGVTGDLGENNRFRYKILWLSWAIAAVGHAAIVRVAAAGTRRGWHVVLTQCARLRAGHSGPDR